MARSCRCMMLMILVITLTFASWLLGSQSTLMVGKAQSARQTMTRIERGVQPATATTATARW